MKPWLFAFLLFGSLCSQAQRRDVPQHPSIEWKEVEVAFRIDVYCENMTSSLEWNILSIPDSIQPHELTLLAYYYEGGDTNKNVIRNEVLDSALLYENNHLWASAPGYYYLTGTDSLRHLKFKSPILYLGLCSQYLLPDKFLYSEGKLLQPLRNQSIERVDMVLFNSLGEEVFSGSDPALNWNLRNKNSGELCPPGSYFYNCDVYERNGDKIVKKNITGIIEIIY